VTSLDDDQEMDEKYRVKRRFVKVISLWKALKERCEAM
jgi:hypothetical protein